MTAKVKTILVLANFYILHASFSILSVKKKCPKEIYVYIKHVVTSSIFRYFNGKFLIDWFRITWHLDFEICKQGKSVQNIQVSKHNWGKVMLHNNSSLLRMHSHMVFFQVASKCKWFMTNVAVKWLLTSVCALVDIQFGIFSKTFSTLTTFVSFLSRVGAHMSNNMRPARETLITNSTTIRFLTGMSSPMYFQMSTSTEWFLTHYTLMFFLASVDSYMLCQISL